MDPVSIIGHTLHHSLQGSTPMKNRKRFLTPAALLLTGVLALLTYVYAHAFQKNYTDEECYCDIDAELAFSTGVSGNSHGVMQMGVAENGNLADGTAFQTLYPISFNSSGHIPEMGDITWKLHPVADVELSRIQANQPDALYPATCDIYFYVEAYSSEYPGQVFLSSTPVHMRSTDLMSFNPHHDGQYRVVAPVDFITPDGDVAFTVTELRSILN